MKQEQSLVNRIISIDNRLFIITATKIEIICELWYLRLLFLGIKNVKEAVNLYVQN